MPTKGGCGGGKKVCVCVSEFYYKSLARSNHRYNRVLSVALFHQTRRCKATKTEDECQNMEGRCPSPSKVPWVLKKKKKKIKSIERPRKKVQKVSRQIELKRIL